MTHMEWWSGSYQGLNDRACLRCSLEGVSAYPGDYSHRKVNNHIIGLEYFQDVAKSLEQLCAKETLKGRPGGPSTNTNIHKHKQYIANKLTLTKSCCMKTASSISS